MKKKDTIMLSHQPLLEEHYLGNQHQPIQKTSAYLHAVRAKHTNWIQNYKHASIKLLQANKCKCLRKEFSSTEKVFILFPSNHHLPYLSIAIDIHISCLYTLLILLMYMLPRFTTIYIISSPDTHGIKVQRLQPLDYLLYSHAQTSYILTFGTLNISWPQL